MKLSATLTQSTNPAYLHLTGKSGTVIVHKDDSVSFKTDNSIVTFQDVISIHGGLDCLVIKTKKEKLTFKL